jgi:pimeloyl-ACP methyl ester carboxylesterase
MGTLQRTYTRGRLAAALNPVHHLHRTPFGLPAIPFAAITADKVTIRGTLLGPQHRHALVLGHGFASTHRSLHLVWLAEQLAERFAVLSFDWRGYGMSDGLASFGCDEAQDLAAVIAHARELGFARVGVVGESMGGMIALAAVGAGTARPDAMATISAPAAYDLTGWPRPHLLRHLLPQRWAAHIGPLLGFRMGTAAPARPIDVADAITLPLLLIHGTADTTVPYRNAVALQNAIPAATLSTFPGANHAVHGLRANDPRRLVEDLVNYFSDHGFDDV